MRDTKYDHETGLYYLIARYYHPTHGVFLSMDPDPGDSDDILIQNGYTYANNNPVMLVDPDGHFVWMAINAGFAAYDGYKAFKKGGWKAAAIAVGVGLVGGAAFKGAKIAYRAYKAGKFSRTYRLAKKVSKKFGGTLGRTKGDGWKVTIADGRKPLVVRVMNKGGIRNKPYFRISKDGRGSLKLNGEWSSHRELTHINVSRRSYKQIVRAISKYRR
ncbi:RHS repeat-associated core domain-containing protein [Aeribacillus sp. FSL K6-8210]|uniref:RHS repeat-associated core domain-containing protein n=1 Tax=Aeribacillus sp. FSL K6-8210 TaxID=2954683 RepID=UPI0030D17703